MKAIYRPLIALMAVVAAALPAAAQERELNLVFGGGLAVAPAYPGSDEYETRPDVNFSFGAFSWGNGAANSSTATGNENTLPTVFTHCLFWIQKLLSSAPEKYAGDP